MFRRILLQQTLTVGVSECENKENAPFLLPEPSLALFPGSFSLLKMSQEVSISCRNFSQRKLQFERRRRLCPAGKKTLGKHFSGTKISFIIRPDSRSERVSLREIKVGETVTKPKETSDFTGRRRRGQIKAFHEILSL